MSSLFLWVVLVGVFFMVIGCGRGEYPLEGTRPVGVVRTDFYDTVEDTVQLSGVDFLGWDRADPRKIRRVSCAVSSSVMGERFSVSLDGGAVGDPVGVADAVQAEWRSRGWVLGPRFDELEAVIPGVQISVTSQTGIVIVLRPSTIRSTIEASSDCTADPAASVRPSSTVSPSSAPCNARAHRSGKFVSSVSMASSR